MPRWPTDRTLAHIGERYGRLEVVAVSNQKYRGWPVYECKCDCGNVIHRRLTALSTGNTRSCGCLKKESEKIAKTFTHRMSNTRIYKIWVQMLKRCRKPTHISYPHYGGRGIKVCDQWHSFENFYADMGDPPEGLTLDRINNDGNYEPGNCRWATDEEQGSNRSTNVLITVNGETKTLAQWSRQNGIGETTICWRLANGWPPDDAVRMKPSFLRKENRSNA